MTTTTDRAGSIYLIRHLDGRLKIGFTTKLQRRLANHSVYSQIDIVKVIPNQSLEDEIALHRCFALFRMGSEREWYSDVKEIREWFEQRGISYNPCRCGSYLLSDGACVDEYGRHDARIAIEDPVSNAAAVLGHKGGCAGARRLGGNAGGVRPGCGYPKGRPRSKAPRCNCGAMTAKRAKARVHKC